MCPLCKLHAVLVYYQYNLRLLHWKIAGVGFDEGHSVMDDYVSQFSDFIDKVGEIILSRNDEHTPLSLEDIIKCLNEDNDQYMRVNPNTTFTKETVFACTSSMFKQIMDIAYDAREQVSDDIASELDSIIYWFRIENCYKMKHRLSGTAMNG